MIIKGEPLYDIGTFIYLAGIIIGLVFGIHYGTHAPWWKSAVGRMFMIVVLAVVLAGATVVLQIAVPLDNDHPARLTMRLLGYGGYTAAMAFILGTYLHERRQASSPLPLPPRREQQMSNTIPAAQAATLEVAPSPLATYAAAILSIGLVVIQAFVAVTEFTPTAIIQLAIVAVGAIGTYLAPVVDGRWAGALKVGVAVVAAILSACVPLVTGDVYTPQTIALVVLAGMQALAAEVGVGIRRADYARAA